MDPGCARVGHSSGARDPRAASFRGSAHLTEIEGAPSNPAAPASIYRCFLFADLRGYTAYIESAGNASGVALLDDYLAIMRRAVAGHNGAEIKVEGDGFHAVFPSASSAVMCGLEICHAAEEASAAQPDRPIRVGIGIHAGEAVETADGYIGSAVNIAARVCAAAAAGEVLVTSTVRGVAQASIPVRFEKRGSRRLKGIAEPVELFAAVPVDTPVARKRPSSRWLAAGAVAVVIALGVLGGAAIVLSNQPGGPGPSASPSVPLLPDGIGPLGIGEYAAHDFTPPFKLAISDPGWALIQNDASAVGLYHDADPRGRLHIARIERLFTDACSGAEGPSIPAGESAFDMIGALRSISFLQVGAAEPITIGEREGFSMDVDVVDGAQAACGSVGGAGIPVMTIGDEAWAAQPGERFRLLAMDVGDETVTFLQSVDSTTFGNGSVPFELDQFLTVADRIVQSTTF
ncbi:MAG TPA: adenylate/guanylate cyclase domain-containing protein [Candidatus Limnocylindrales bacterium]|nr:adenylate/guanylate cyclase domain-containing protein [Candidatus Limnocylindrales bacterium]